MREPPAGPACTGAGLPSCRPAVAQPAPAQPRSAAARGAVLLLCLEDFLVVLFPASLVPVAQETEPMSPCLEIPLNRTGKETRKILIRGDDPGAIRVLCS